MFGRLAWAALASTLIPFVSAAASTDGRLLSTTSAQTCIENSQVSATKADVVFTPGNNSLVFDIAGISTVSGNVTLIYFIYAYGKLIRSDKINPCESETLKGMCPMSAGPLNMYSLVKVPDDSVSSIPGIAYTVPDIDLNVQIYWNSTATQQAVACVQAQLSNGKTVYLPAVEWVIAVIFGLGLVASAVASGLGHTNTAAHVAANTMSLFGYFQAQALIGMTAIPLPPIASSWTQDFQWSMGIIRVDFINTIATWYQRATGGTPSTVIAASETVQIRKRSVEVMASFVKRGAQNVAGALWKRADNASQQIIIVSGIERVGYRAGIELTNIFMTGYIFFIIFIACVVLIVVLFKAACEGLVKAGAMKGDKFIDFRNGWTTVLKGILFRVALIGFPQMMVLCFWELTRRHSAGIVVLAITTIITLLAVLAWASSKVIRLARRSIHMHKNPAYILYSDPVTLNKWGFLYVPYKATAYFWIVAALTFILVKALFVALGQGSGTVQAIALLVLDGAYLVALCVMTPFMDTKTNAFNIAIQVMNFLNAIFLLFFTNIFGAPAIVNGVMGVALAFVNAVFALVLLILLLVASAFAIFSKNPDVRYAPMRDDRGSFIKSATHLPNELDALGATARGEGRNNGSNPSQLNQKSRLEDDEDGYSSSDLGSRVGGNSSAMAGRYHENLSPVSPNPSATAYNGGAYHNEKSGFYGSSAPHIPRSGTSSPAPSSRQGHRNGPSPWQRGAGYD